MLDTSGKETHLRYLHMWPERPCLWSRTTHREAPREIPYLPSGVPRHLSRDPEGWSPPLLGYNWGRLQTTAETAELHTPECCSSPHWSPLASAAGGSAMLDWGLYLPCCPSGSKKFFLARRWHPLAHCAFSWTSWLRFWDSGLLFPLNCCVCVLYFS